MIELVPEGQGDEPRIALNSKVIEFINSDKIPTPPAVNAYQCRRRKGHIIVTIDTHPGVTPMFMQCKYQFCPGSSNSMVYPTGPLPDVLKTAPLWVWYRPSELELVRDHDGYTVEHVSKGGLLLRKSDQSYYQFMEEWNANH